MRDMNGIQIELGDTVKDNMGNVGVFTDVNGCESVKFDSKGKTHYVFTHKLVESQIEVVKETV